MGYIEDLLASNEQVVYTSRKHWIAPLFATVGGSLLTIGGLVAIGLAFFTWDVGMKHGDIQFLGVAAYATPILSTLLLVLAGFGAFTPAVLAGAVLVTGGALLASADALRRRG